MARSMSSIGPTMLHRNNYGTSTPGLNNIGEPSTADVMSHTETSNSSIGTPVTHFPTSFNGGMRNSPSFQQQLKRQQMKLNLSTPTTPVVEHNPQPQTYSSSRRSSTIDYGQPETPSEMNAMVHNHNHSMPTSTPNKIAVAPLQKPRRTERDERDHSFSQKSHHHRGYDKRVMPLRSPYQCANSPSSSGSSARSPSVGARVGSPLSTPVPIDLPPSSQTPSTQELADRVRFLEHCIASSSVASPVSDMQMNATSLMFASGSSHGHQVTPTSRIHRTAQLVVSTTPTMAMSPYNLAQQQIMARDVVEKDYTIESMRRQIEQLHKQMETRQIQYDEDVNSFKRESEDARGQLLTLKSKIGDLENESKVYQDKSTRLDQTRQVAIVESQEKLLAQEKELSTLRQELAKKEQLSHDYEQMKKERDWFDKQNESLSQQLDETDAIKKSNELLMMRLQERDAQVKELEDTILAMEIKANMSLSNGGKGFFYDEDDDDISVDHLMPSGSATPVSSSNFDLTGFHRVSKSASTHQIGADCNMNNRVISNQMAQMFMGLLRKSNECKVIARCLTETAGNIADGKEPNFNRLLGCYSDVSESDSEPMIKGSASSTTNMTTAVAERYLRKNNEDLARVEQQLNELRSKFVAFYQHRCEAKQCQIQ